MYWDDIRAPACKIELNAGLIAYMLEEFTGSEPRFAHVRRVTKAIQQHITWCLGHNESIQPLHELVTDFWGREEVSKDPPPSVESQDSELP